MRKAAGSIRQRTPGSWTLSWYNPTMGKRQQETLRGTQAEAEKRLRQVLAQKDKGELANSGALTVGAWLETWLTEYRPHRVAPSTHASTASHVRLRLIPSLGHLRLDKLTKAQIHTALDAWLALGLAPDTVGTYFRTLATALGEAVERQLIARSPAAGVAAPKGAKGEPRPITLPQAAPLLAVAEGHALHPLILLALTTGARRGELLALTWTSLDFEHGLLEISRSFSRYGFAKTKTRSSRRSLDLDPAVLASLRQHKGRQAQERLAAGRSYQCQDLIFARADGRPWNADYVPKQFNRLVAQAGLPPMKFHDLRHSMACEWLGNRESVKLVQARLGHASAKTTLDKYGHVLPGEHKAAAARAGERFAAAQTERKEQTG